MRFQSDHALPTRPGLASTVAGGVFLAMLAAAGVAGAQSSAESAAAAEALFQEGKKLMAEGKYADACPKLVNSQNLDPAVGTLLNLADCFERNGQIASAWATFKDVVAGAKTAGQSERAETARRRASALEPRLPRLVIEVSASALPAIAEIKRDGVVVPKGVWGVQLPVDPGDHVVEASGPGHKTWSQRVTAAEGKTVTIAVPPPGGDTTASTVPAGLPQAQPPAEPPATPQPNEPPSPAQPAPTSRRAATSSWSGQKTAAVVVGGVGVLALGIDAFIVLGAKAKYDGADCPNGNLCSQAGYEDRQSAFGMARTAGVVFGVGAAAAVGAAVLWITAPSSVSTGSSVGIQPMATAGGGSLSLKGTW
jgi:hypothetical protein